MAGSKAGSCRSNVRYSIIPKFQLLLSLTSVKTLGTCAMGCELATASGIPPRAALPTVRVN
jgi:hypothetical protein